MRLTACVALAALLAAAHPAAADTITQDIAVTGSVQNEPIFVTGALFNQGLGTLTGVSATIVGRFSGDVFIPGPAPLQFTDELQGSLNAPNQSISGDLGTFMLTSTTPGGGGNYTGDAGFHADVTFTDIAAYLAGSPDATNYLAEISIGDRVTSGATGASDDFSTFSYNFDLTYTYDVPEPSSLLVFGLAATLFLAAASKKVRSSFSVEKAAKRL